ncbi:Gfo/Idh/MocA family protein [Paenibacillus yanchengensis]|uniref:Gfo/Idh/MocA family protein n=1 Tax=Paenibacillus yanchengensis TaxID=2035833 RepID=A0ABW4YJS3_9BACL
MKVWNFAIIGCGSIADFHAEAISQLSNARLVAVSSRSEQKAAAFASKVNSEWTSDYNELLQRADIDIVCITTSSGSHATIGLAAIAAGKHVVIEKPLAMRTTDGAELVRAARAANVKLSVISQRRFEPQHQLVKQMLTSGALGKLLLVEASLPFYRSQDYYDSASWRGTIAEDGGALMNQGIHSVDLLLWFAGSVQSVMGEIATQTHQMEAEDMGLAIVKFEGGTLGTIMASTSIQPGFQATMHLYGSLGTIKLEGSSITYWHVRGHEQPQAEQEKSYGGVSDPRNLVADYHRIQFADVISAIEQDVTPLVSGADGVRAVELVESIYASSVTGKRIDTFVEL